MRTLLVGLDAACHRVLEPLFASGDLPTLSAVFEAGASGPLESQVPPWTASAWPSLYTGTNPGKHGVFGFLAFDGYDWDVVDGSHVRERAIWEYLDEHDLSSVVVNVPVTHPPRAFDGAIVPGYAAPEPPACHPEGLLDEIESAVGPYRIYADDESGSAGDADETVADLCDLVALRGETFRYLADRVDPDFGFVQFQATDTVCHQLPETDAVRRVYRAVDDQVGEILDACDPSVVLVASDHGIGPYERRVAVNEVLRRAGLVETTSRGSGMPTWATIREDDLRGGPNGSGRLDGAPVRLVGAAARFGLSAQRVGRLLDRLGLADLVLRHTPDSLLRAGSERVDFPRSVAYARSRVECGVRINLEGREPEGVVSPDEYEDVREQVIDLLGGLETPEGEPVFETVARREAFFDGPESERAVDVVTVPADYDSYLTTWLTERVFPPVEARLWDHKRDGVFAVAGDGVDADASVDGAHLFDVAPTVLATLGVPAAGRMDGRTLPPVRSAGERTYDDLAREERTVTTDEAVEDRLADLGYLE